MRDLVPGSSPMIGTEQQLTENLILISLLMKNHLLWLTLSGALALAAPAYAQNAAPVWDVYADTWVATDGLGRSMPTAADVGPPRANREVGLFYSLWPSRDSIRAASLQSAEILKKQSAAMQPDRDGVFGGSPDFRRRNEPIWGDYNVRDEAIIRKHAQMLADAGVDMLLLDASNAIYSPDAVNAITKVLHEMKAQGMKVPRLAFRGVAAAGDRQIAQVKTIYQTFYKAGANDDLWYRWKGRPLIIADPDQNFAPGIREYFSFCKSNRDERNPNLEVWNTNSATGSFQDNWDFALQRDPQFILVYGWNEWVAPRFEHPDGNGYSGAPLNDEFSRDIGPARGNFGDAYFYQLARNIRRYKGARALPPISHATITPQSDWASWKNVAPEFRDTLSDSVKRDSVGTNALLGSINQTSRNDIRLAKSALAGDDLAFYVQTNGPLTAATSGDWMTLYVDADQNAKTGWLGYDFRVSPATGLIERNSGGLYAWVKPQHVSVRATENALQILVPLQTLGLTQNSAGVDFKWTDNCFVKGNWSDFTLNGDAAPNDRFNYRAKFRE